MTMHLLGFPILVMLEYSNIMAKILDYLNNLSRGSSSNSDDSSNKKDQSLQQVLLDELVVKLNNRFVTVIWVVLIHAAMLTFKVSHIGLINSLIFMAMVGVKLYVYCRFMDSQHR